MITCTKEIGELQSPNPPGACVDHPSQKLHPGRKYRFIMGDGGLLDGQILGKSTFRHVFWGILEGYRSYSYGKQKNALKYIPGGGIPAV